MIIELVRGDDATVAITASEDLSTAQGVRFTAKRSIDDADADAVLAYDLDSGVSVAAAVATITIPAADTADEPAPVVWVWDVEATDSEGLVTTVASGYLRLSPDVTREPAGS